MIKVCPICGKEFKTRTSKKTYCSRNCAAKTKVKDLTNNVYGRLTVKGLAYFKNKRSYWLCSCECGNTTIVNSHNLVSGNTQSCGCLLNAQRKENGKKMLEANKINSPKKTHGLSKHRLYKVWQDMKTRCYCKTNKHYPSYGGRGIKICQEWLDSFINFYNWAYANGYDDTVPNRQCTIDRINVNENYEPTNCRWVTQKQQNRNTRKNVLYEYKNKKYTRGELSEISNISYGVIRYRLNNGWSIEKTLTTPVKR